MNKSVFAFLLCWLTIMPARAYETLLSPELHVWAEFPNPIVADGKTINYVKVFEHDDNGLQYSAFNMEIILPVGFRVNQVKQGRETVNDIFLSDRATSTHSISCNLYQGYDLRIISTSSQNFNFFDDDVEGNPIDELFTIGLIADPTLSAGDYEVHLEGIKFVLADANARIPEPEVISYTIHVDNPIATGLEEVKASEIDTYDCYDLEGHQVDITTVHNIIIVANGRKYLLR